jgi:hypothetical protein
MALTKSFAGYHFTDINLIINSKVPKHEFCLTN